MAQKVVEDTFRVDETILNISFHETPPQTPMVQSKCCSSLVTCKSIAEKEFEELKKLRPYTFSTQELDPRTSESGPSHSRNHLLSHLVLIWELRKESGSESQG